MFEFGIAIAACVAMGKIADAEGRSAVVWGAITMGLCLASLAIPLPYLRFFLAGLAAFIAMMVAKARGGP